MLPPSLYLVNSLVLELAMVEDMGVDMDKAMAEVEISIMWVKFQVDLAENSRFVGIAEAVVTGKQIPQAQSYITMEVNICS